jgi:predicted aminopeptidase
MLQAARWVRLCVSYCLFAIFVSSALHYELSVYLCRQAGGQFSILYNRQNLSGYEKESGLSAAEKDNMRLVEKIKRYSVDSLEYLPTNNFTEIYDQKNSPVLWVITASDPYELKAYEWEFPLLGRVSYKGFFSKDLAQKEYNSLRARGYDVDVRSVSAWSTLGWFNDPLLSSMLKRSKGSLCNLLFHELFHATCYAPNAVNFNENMASFIGHKATIQFLQNDSAALREYLDNYQDNLVFTAFMQRQNLRMKEFYSQTGRAPDRFLLKLKAIQSIVDSVSFLPVKNKRLSRIRQQEILAQKNAYFIDFEQYDSMQDSLERVFNKIYKGDLKKLVRDLKQNQTIAKFDN